MMNYILTTLTAFGCRLNEVTSFCLVGSISLKFISSQTKGTSHSPFSGMSNHFSWLFFLPHSDINFAQNKK